MKGGKEEDKIMEPLFPRLHVNDADKGGPRAPPRNKMALYEQLCTPSQRFNSSVASSLPLPPHKGSALGPSGSSSQGYGYERSVFSPFYVPPHVPSHSTERVHSHSSDGTNLNNTRKEFERRSKKHMNNSSSNARGSVAECSSLRPHDSSNAKISSGNFFDDEDDFRVPTFVQSEIAAFSNKNAPAIEPEKLTPFRANNLQESCSGTLSSSRQFPNSNDKHSERTNTYDMKSRNYERSRNKETSVIKDSAELSESHPELGERSAEPSNFAKTSSDQEHRGTNAFKNSSNGNAELFPESCGNGALGRPTDIDVVEKGDALRARNESCSKASLRNNHSSPKVADKCHRESDDKANGSLELGDVDRNDVVSEASIVDSILGMEISPDDVVGVIGLKHFWKARRAIVNQQRVFAVQVFELHRLIKVQKLIAASPDVLDGIRYLNRSPPKVPTKNLPLPQQHIGKSLLQAQKPNQNIGDPPLPSHEDNLNKGLPDQIPRTTPYSGNPPPGPMAPDNRPSPWCFQPPKNQWLVPVMSPSEGLIYKPYSGPCPPTGGFMAPIYGSCAPMGLPPMAGDFMNLAYSVPPSHQQQVNPLAGHQPNGQHSRSSCNVSNPRSEAFSGHRRKFHASKDSEVQGSTASSPCEKTQGNDALHLFPMAPAMESCGQDNRQSHVIRVVPHNARSAMESAARIFRSIQEERQHHDS